MTNTHLTDKGPMPCKAKTVETCRAKYAGKPSPHFNDSAAAQREFEADLEAEHGVVSPPVRKKASVPAAKTSPAVTSDPNVAARQRLNEIVKNTTNTEKLAELVRSGDRDVFPAIAANQHTRPKDLGFLAEDRDPAVRAAVAGNPSTPRWALEMLDVDSDNRVQRELAKNPATKPIDERRGRIAERRSDVLSDNHIPVPMNKEDQDSYRQTVVDSLNKRFGPRGYTFDAEVGRKYTRITKESHGTGRSVFMFIDNETGGFLKAAGWKKPAAGVRYAPRSHKQADDLLSSDQVDPYGSWLYAR